MRRILVSPKWLLGHALALAAAVASVRLGWWQWAQAQSGTGSLQNLGYAVQWPAFGLFIIVFWSRVIRDRLRPPSPEPRQRAPGAVPAGGRPTPQQPRPPLAADDPEDAEVIAYNQYLAWLDEQDSRRAR